MKVVRTLTLGAALLTTSAWAFGQGYYQPMQFHDRDDRAAYRQGYQQGQIDARNHRGFHPDADRYREGDDRRAFRDGYEAGYRSSGGRDWDRDRNRDRDRNNPYNNGAYNNGGYYGGSYGNMNSIAQQNGYRDGINDGRKDRRTGHSFRPTQDDNYKNAPGYSSNMGDRQQYKNIYRQGYQQGYQIGYNGR